MQVQNLQTSKLMVGESIKFDLDTMYCEWLIHNPTEVWYKMLDISQWKLLYFAFKRQMQRLDGKSAILCYSKYLF